MASQPDFASHARDIAFGDSPSHKGALRLRCLPWRAPAMPPGERAACRVRCGAGQSRRAGTS